MKILRFRQETKQKDLTVYHVRKEMSQFVRCLTTKISRPYLLSLFGVMTEIKVTTFLYKVDSFFCRKVFRYLVNTIHGFCNYV